MGPRKEDSGNSHAYHSCLNAWCINSKHVSVELSKEEEKGRRNELKAYCGRLIEDFEDDLIDAVKDGFDEKTGKTF